MDGDAVGGPARTGDVSRAIGDTPLIRLGHASAVTGCEILAKAEFTNPGGSIKDRAALAILEDAERRQVIRPGGIVVEGTAGNTGIGLALLAAVRGYRTVIVMPDTQSREKRDLLLALGAQLRLVPPTDPDHPDNYRRVARRLAEELVGTTDAGVVWADQFDNLANRQAHEATTGPEIWRQSGHRVDAFVAAVGTGGTLAGVSRFLRQVNPDVVVGLADPDGGAMYSYYTSGTLSSDGTSLIEGIGLRWMTANLSGTTVDRAIRVSDAEALETIYSLARHDGLFVGGSSGVNVAGAVRLARELGPGHTVVTVLCDSGTRYASRLFDVDLLRSRNLPLPPWRTAGEDTSDHPAEP